MLEQWRVMVAETLTGEIKADIQYKDQPNFERSLNSKGSLSITAHIDAAPNLGVDFHTYTRPGKYSWILCYGTTIVQAGPIWSHSFDDTTRILSATCGGLFSVLSRRTMRNPAGHTAIVHPSEDLIYSDMSLHDIMRAIVRDNLDQTYYGLPVLLPEPDNLGGNERTYQGYDLAKTGERMTELAAVINGPEFDFAPEWADGGSYIRWRLKVGAPKLGSTETTAVWDYGTESAPISSINVDVNGSESPVTRVWVKGSGNERDLLTGFAEDLTPVAEGYPGLDFVDSDHTSVTEQATLEAYADQDLARLSRAIEKWTCSLRIAGSGAGIEYAPALTEWELGDAPIFAVSGHPWLPANSYRRRVVGYADDGESSISLDLEEIPESPEV